MYVCTYVCTVCVPATHMARISTCARCWHITKILKTERESVANRARQESYYGARVLSSKRREPRAAPKVNRTSRVNTDDRSKYYRRRRGGSHFRALTPGHARTHTTPRGGTARQTPQNLDPPVLLGGNSENSRFLHAEKVLLTGLPPGGNSQADTVPKQKVSSARCERQGKHLPYDKTGKHLKTGEVSLKYS